ncbi:MAG: zinc ABC transporter substrate-binding protein [Candidatus Krumholzibacteria bacterium]|nr:zinc ABC transporter substrate-binding protein [Candidatus Krumholzibacteria bacterium]
MIRVLVMAGLVFMLGCESGGQMETSTGSLKVTTTTGIVAEVVRKVGGDHVSVVNLMGPGVDPHLYKASEGDIQRLEKADLIFYNGLNLEGKMGEIFVKMARKGKLTFALSESVDTRLLREPPEFQGHYDPHIWFDVSLWAQTIPVVVGALSEAKPSARGDFVANGERYDAELADLHEYCRDRLASIPSERRVLVTAHDAFGYFGRAYNIEVVGLQGITTTSEYGLKDVQRIVQLITERRLSAVFVESSVPKRSIEAVVAGVRSRGHNVRIGGQLFSDAMGEPGTPEGTYPGMVRHNVETIVQSLK